MKTRTAFAFVAMLTLWCGTSRADVDCTGTVTLLSVYLDGAGTVTLSLSNGPLSVYVCGIEQQRNGVAPSVCRTLYATLMAAKLSAKQVRIRFYGHSSCAAIPPWADAGQLGWTELLID